MNIAKALNVHAKRARLVLLLSASLAPAVASIACADPPAAAPSSKDKNSKNKGDDDDDDSSKTKQVSSDLVSKPAVSTTAAPTAPPSSSAPPGAFPQGMACFDQCTATGVAAQYWSCARQCRDQNCDTSCWQQFCGQNDPACRSAMNMCMSQCGSPSQQQPIGQPNVFIQPAPQQDPGFGAIAGPLIGLFGNVLGGIFNGSGSSSDTGGDFGGGGDFSGGGSCGSTNPCTTR
jgi:hypothetical protein